MNNGGKFTGTTRRKERSCWRIAGAQGLLYPFKSLWQGNQPGSFPVSQQMKLLAEALSVVELEKLFNFLVVRGNTGCTTGKEPALLAHSAKQSHLSFRHLSVKAKMWTRTATAYAWSYCTAAVRQAVQSTCQDRVRMPRDPNVTPYYGHA